MSGVITVAILVYPPVTCLSTISIIGLQFPGHQGDIQAYMLGLLRWRQDDVGGTKGYAETLRQRAHPQAKNDLAYSYARTL